MSFKEAVGNVMKKGGKGKKPMPKKGGKGGKKPFPAEMMKGGKGGPDKDDDDKSMKKPASGKRC